VRRLGVTLIMLAGVQSSIFGQDDRLVVKPDPDDSSRLICGVEFATFKTPKGWRPNRSGKETFAILTRADESYPNVTQMISIDIGKPRVPNAKGQGKRAYMLIGGAKDDKMLGKAMDELIESWKWKK